MAKIVMAASEPEKVEFTVEITLSLSDWRKVREKLGEGGGLLFWPFDWLRDGLRVVIDKGVAEFTDEVEMER